MKFFNFAKQTVQNRYAQMGVLLTVSGSALADASANEGAITAAITGGKKLVELTTTGVIGLAALGFGVGMVVSWLARK
ncbi:hypothetical protein LYZ37_23180 (plasmid) [Vibrio tubiashii]|uniref:hypothetical protein n=1 Tax=Vibrio tubiashii TaxID=29498 RepID=UPI00234F39A3|nr:hypothetical protein [Vibrio tubiashii]WCP70333.1 hypothetical protein LYZ37_23180 [Vibrio tubiashii]